MKGSIFYSTDTGNHYLYDINNKYSLVIHPDLEKASQDACDVNSYYKKKYEYLKKYGFFKPVDSVSFETKVDEDVVNRNISNIEQIVFEVTDYCNLSCEYCSLGDLYDFGKKNHKNIDRDHAMDFLEYIFDIKKVKSKLMISFFGGEPLLNFKFIEDILRKVQILNREKKLVISYNITTNATLLYKYMDFLVHNNFILLISLDGDAMAHSYRKYIKNNKSSHKDVVNSIDLIQSTYPNFFLNNVDFNAVLSDKNSVKNIIDFIYDRYHKVPRISELNSTCVNVDKMETFKKIFHSRRASENEYLSNPNRQNPIRHTRLMIYGESRSFFKNYSINYSILNPICLLYDRIDAFPTGSCLAFQKKIFFNTNNELLPCEKINHKYFLGKVENGVHVNVSEIAVRYSAYFDKASKVCKKCYAQHSCPICLMTLDQLGNVESGDFCCYGFLDEDKFRDKLIRIYSFFERHKDDLLQIMNFEQ